ncbi:MAG: pseudouridine synthase, partial [Solirubrobacteraceae bacterium]
MSEEAVVVPAALDGERLDRAVCLLVGLSRSGASRLIKDGAVKIGEVPVTDRSHRLAAGELLSIDAERLDRTGAAPAASGPGRAGDVRFSVVYEDGDVIVVDKPSGLVTHPGAGNRDGTLAAGLLAAYPELADLPKAGYGTPERPGIVHRLDKETSGLLAIARSPAGFESLTAQLAARSMKRIYLALCSGHVAAASWLVDAPIGRSAR